MPNIAPVFTYARLEYSSQAQAQQNQQSLANQQMSNQTGFLSSLLSGVFR